MPATILVVEDEWLIAEDYASILLDAGHVVLGPCASLDSAMATIGEHAIDAALLDMELFGEKSFAVAHRLQEQGIPFAFVSGHAAEELPPALRGHLVLAKPTDQARLLEAVEDLVGGRAAG